MPRTEFNRVRQDDGSYSYVKDDIAREHIEQVVSSVDGVHGFRYYEGNTQIKNSTTGDWETISSGGGGGVVLADVSGASVSSYKTAVSLTWSDPADIVIEDIPLATWSGTKIVRKENSAPSNHNDGTLIADSKTRNAHSTAALVDNTTEYGKTYYYRFFPYTTGETYTNGSSVTIAPTRVVISTIPTQSGSITYDTTTKEPSWNNYSSTELTIGGDTDGVNAGTYNATFTPTADYCWNDGSQDAETVQWVIGKAPLTVPSQVGTEPYDGTEKTATWDANYDSTKMTVTGDTATTVGEHTATFSLIDTSNYQWSDGTIADKDVVWNIGKVKLTPPSVTNTSKTYNRSAQSPTIDTYDTTKIAVTNSGNTTASATDAGNYTVQFTIIDTNSYEWVDGAVTSVSWTISPKTVTYTAMTDKSKTYNTQEQSPTIPTYDTNEVTVGGVTAATNASSTPFTVTFSLTNTNNYVWDDGTTAQKSDTWTIAKATFTSTVSISGYTYAGTKSAPTVSNNPGNGVVTYYGRSTATGTATEWSNVTNTTYDAGTRYVYAVIAATDNYESYTTENASFTIAKGSFTATVNISGYTYAGTKSTPTVSNNPGSATVTYYGRASASGTATTWDSVTSTTYDAGTRYVYAVIAESTNYNGYTTENTSFSIAKASFTATVSINNYTYAGTKSTPNVSSNPGSGTVTYYGRSTSTGTATEWTSVTNTTYDAGTRYIYATIAETVNYNSYTTENASFTINKADATVTVSKTSVSLTTSNLYDDVTITKTGDGTLSVTSSNTSYATVANQSGSTYRITGVANGSTTVVASVPATTNYNAASKNISVSVSLIGTLEQTSWSDISSVSKAGNASTYWNVGDTKSVSVNGTVGTLSVNQTLYVFILEFNHNSSKEGTGISFGCFKTASSGGTDVCLVDSNYGSNKCDGTKTFSMNHWGSSSYPYNTNYGGWKGCDARYDILGSTRTQPSGYGSTPTTSRVGYDAPTNTATSPVSNTLMAALPSTLRSVMKPITKYTDNVGNSSNTAANVTTSVDYLPLLSEFEVQGARTYANENEKTNQLQYQYYINGNSKVKYKHSSTGDAAYWWCRSADCNSAAGFFIVSTVGDAFNRGSRDSYGLAPCFLV